MVDKPDSVRIDPEEFREFMGYLALANFRVDKDCVIPMRDIFVESGYAKVFPDGWDIQTCSAAWCFGFTRGVAMAERRGKS